MNFEEVKRQEQENLMPTYGRFPVALVYGKGAVAVDTEGKEYIDFTSGIGVNSLGYCDDGWVSAVAKQAGAIQHMSNLYYSPVQTSLAAELCRLTGFGRVFFCNSGAEANECAIKLARKYSADKYGKQRTEIVTLVNSFHGRTVTTLAATGQDVFHEHFWPFTEGFSYARANDFESLLSCVTENTCAVLIELIQGEGGVMPLEKEFVRKTAALCKGKDILLMIDNTPAVMLLPCSLFRFLEEVNDYYFPPLVGTYLRIVRVIVLFLTLFVTPLWYLLVKSPDTLHESLHFLLIEDEYYVPLILQLLLVEFIIDVLKLASLNTPDVLSNSFSMLGALILGDFAVQARWLVPEVLVYMAFVAIANYAQHSYEMGYAVKLCRMALLLLIWLFDWWGFIGGILGILTLIASTRPLIGKGYLYPFIPFNGKDLWALLHHRPIDRNNS